MLARKSSSVTEIFKQIDGTEVFLIANLFLKDVQNSLNIQNSNFQYSPIFDSWQNKRILKSKVLVFIT